MQEINNTTIETKEENKTDNQQPTQAPAMFTMSPELVTACSGSIVDAYYISGYAAGVVLPNEAKTRDLLKKGLLIPDVKQPEKIKQLLVDNRPTGGGGYGNEQCTWCETYTVKLHSHHYPKQRKDGGTETVNICPNCHQSFHSLMAVTRLTSLAPALDRFFNTSPKAETKAA